MTDPRNTDGRIFAGMVPYPVAGTDNDRPEGLAASAASLTVLLVLAGWFFPFHNTLDEKSVIAAYMLFAVPLLAVGGLFVLSVLPARATLVLHAVGIASMLGFSALHLLVPGPLQFLDSHRWIMALGWPAIMFVAVAGTFAAKDTFPALRSTTKGVGLSLAVMTASVLLNPNLAALVGKLHRFDTRPGFVFFAAFAVLAFLVVASVLRNKTRPGWSLALFAVGAVAVLVFVYPAHPVVDYYHAHPFVAPAYAWFHGAGDLFRDIISQYGAGPIMVSAVAQSTGLPAFEATALCAHAMTWAVFVAFGLAVVLVSRGSMTAAVLAVLLLIAAPLAAYGYPYFNYPSIFAFRLVPPVIAALLLFARDDRSRSLALGAVWGLAPFWSLEAAVFVSAIVASWFLWVFMARPLRRIDAAVPAVAAAVYLAVYGLLWLHLGGAPDLFIQREIVATYLEYDAYNLRDPDDSIAFVVPLVIALSYFVFFGTLFLVRLFRRRPLAELGTRRALFLHATASLTIVSLIYYISRPAIWIIPGAHLFALLFVAVLCAGEGLARGRRVAVLVFALALAGTAAAAIQWNIAEKGIGWRSGTLGYQLAHGDRPDFTLSTRYALFLRHGSRKPIVDAVRRYRAEGYPVEVVTTNGLTAELLRMNGDIGVHLPVGAWFNDSMSPTRMAAIRAAALNLPDGLVLVAPPPGFEALIVQRVPSQAPTVLTALNDAGRLCVLEKAPRVVAYIVHDGGCAPPLQKP